MSKKDLENPVQKHYYEEFQKIWAGGIDDWHDMNNFMIALLQFSKDTFHSFSHWTQKCFSNKPEGINHYDK
jgi:hypothetical protein